MQIRYSPKADILLVKLSDKPVYESEHLADEGIVRFEISEWNRRKEANLPYVGKLFPVSA